MSRVGKRPIPIPSGVTVGIAQDEVNVKGPKGELSTKIPPGVSVHLEEGSVRVVPRGEGPRARALFGTTRAVIADLIKGVNAGFSKALEVVGTGYRAQLEGGKLVLFLGFAKPVEFVPPAGIHIEVESPTRVVVSGIDRVLVGQTAAEIRDFKKPEPYKGKGIRYVGEYVRKKAGKAAVGSAGA